jgi:predicted metal-binding membrane protein
VGLGRMDVLALIFMVAALVMFAFAASGRELRHFNEIALGLVFLTAALIFQFTAITNATIGR